MSEYGDRRDAIICPYCGAAFNDEEYRHVSYYGSENGPKYKGSDTTVTRSFPEWRSSRVMPAWASRTTGKIVGVRAERLQGISHEDACAEGFGEWLREPTEAAPHGRTWGRLGFSQHWDSVNAKRGFPWEGNYWVFVYEFERCAR